MYELKNIKIWEQLRQKEREYSFWAHYFSELRYRVLSVSIPKRIIITNGGYVQYEYTKDVETNLKQIDKIEKEILINKGIYESIHRFTTKQNSC